MSEPHRWRNPDKHDPNRDGNATNYAAAARVALRYGRELPAVAKELRGTVAERFAEVGAGGMIEDGAFDAEMVCGLYLQSVVQAADLGQRPRLHEACRTWAYLRNTATKHWQMVRDAQIAEGNIHDLSAAVADAEAIINAA